MKIHTKITTLATVAGLTLAAGSAGAAISVTGDTAFQEQSSNPSGLFNAFGADKIVVIASGEAGNPGQQSNGATNITFNGISLTQLVDRNAIAAEVGPPVVAFDQNWNDIWYLDSSDYTGGTFTNADFTVAITSGTRGQVTVIGLAGTADGGGNSVVSGRDTATVDLTTSAGSIVIASYGLGGDGNTASLSGRSWDGATTISAQQTRSWNGHITGYENNVAAGSNTYSFTSGNLTGTNTIAAEFTMIPEPSTTALLGLGGLALIMRRRK